jgi:hypothetical protein
MDPRIPDHAFQAVADRGDELHDVTMATAPSAAHAANAAHAYARSLGLEGEADQRAYALAHSTLAYLRQTDLASIPSDHVYAAVVGITLGLALARETSWEPPIPDPPS